MSKYRKKPVVIDAVHYLGERDEWDIEGSSVPWWFMDAQADGTLRYDEDTGELITRTLEGQHIVSKGDWIIRGVKGELYPCKPDIFAMTYEEVPT